MPIVKKDDVRPGALACVQAPGGAGKTVLGFGFLNACHKLTGKPGLYGDMWEAGSSSAPGGVQCDYWAPSQPVKDAKGNLVEVDPLDDLNDFLFTLRDSDYPCAVIDTVSTAGEVLLSSVTKKDLSEGKDTKRVTVKTKHGEVRVPCMLDYRAAGTMMAQWTFAALKITQQKGKILLLLAHEKPLEMSSESGITLHAQVAPNILGSQLSRDFPKIPNLVARVEVKQGGKRRFIADSDGLYICKDRFRVFAPEGVDIGVDLSKTTSAEAKDKLLLERVTALWVPWLERVLNGGK